MEISENITEINIIQSETYIEKYGNESSDNIAEINLIQKNESFIEECDIKNFLNNKCKMNIFTNQRNITNNANNIDKIIDDIKNNNMDGSMYELITNILEGDKKDLVIEDNNIIYQLTSTENQDNNENMNVSTINLGDCEKILKKEYNISQNQ